MKKCKNECHNSTSVLRLIKVRVKYYQARVVKLGKTTIYHSKIRQLVINFEEIYSLK